MPEEIKPPRPTPEKGSYIQVWDLPPGLKQKFKAACKKRGTTIRETIIKYLERASQGV